MLSKNKKTNKSKFLFQALFSIFIFIIFQLMEGRLEHQIVYNKSIGDFFITQLIIFIMFTIVIFYYFLPLFSNNNKFHECGWFLHALNGVFICVVFAILITHLITPFVHASANQKGLSMLLKNALHQPVYLFTYLMIICVGAPISEEILFRSWLLNIALNTQNKFVKWFTISISVIVFILPHILGGSWYLAFVFLPITILLTGHYLKHQRLIENVVMHGIYNLLTLILI